MFSNNLDAQAIVAGDRQCRLRADSEAWRMSHAWRRSRRHRATAVRPPTVASLRPCVPEVLS